MPKATASLVASFLLQTPLQVKTVSRLGNRHSGPISLALSWAECIRTRYTLRPQVPALIETPDLEGLPTAPPRARHRDFGDRNQKDRQGREALKHPDIWRNFSHNPRDVDRSSKPSFTFEELLKYIRRLTFRNLQQRDLKLLADVLATLNKAVNEALSKNSS